MASAERKYIPLKKKTKKERWRPERRRKKHFRCLCKGKKAALPLLAAAAAPPREGGGSPQLCYHDGSGTASQVTPQGRHRQGSNRRPTVSGSTPLPTRTRHPCTTNRGGCYYCCQRHCHHHTVTTALCVLSRPGRDTRGI